MSQILPLLQLNFKAILRDVLIGLLLVSARGVLEDRPEIRHAEDDARIFEGWEKAGGVIQVCADDFDAFGLPFEGAGGGRGAR